MPVGRSFQSSATKPGARCGTPLETRQLNINTPGSSATSPSLGCISITQDGTTVILTSLPNLTPLYQTRTIRKTGTATRTLATILFDIRIRQGTNLVMISMDAITKIRVTINLI